MKSIIVIVLAVILLAGTGLFLFSGNSQDSLPGQAVADLGRAHVADGTEIEYNSNPPTSGPHFEEWTKSGIYSNPVTDGHLVHSLEHGYIIMSYNCNAGILSFVREVSAHEEDLDTSGPTGDQETGEILEGQWDTRQCLELVNQLGSIYQNKGERKLIVIPRPSLDTKIALTAWTRIDKFNDFDEERINRFIDAFRDQGPERTIE